MKTLVWVLLLACAISSLTWGSRKLEEANAGGAEVRQHIGVEKQAGLTLPLKEPGECRLNRISRYSKHRSYQFEERVAKDLRTFLVNESRGLPLTVPATDTARAAYFVVAASCSGYGDYLSVPVVAGGIADNLDHGICKNIPRGWVAHPVGLLKTQEKSSPDLKALYARNLLTFARILEAGGNSKYEAEARKMRQMAEQVGREAAEEGVKDAYLFLAEQYSNNAFGWTDLPLSYLYSAAVLSDENTPENAGRVEYFYRQLTSREFGKISATAKECESRNRDADNVLLNPFVN